MTAQRPIITFNPNPFIFTRTIFVPPRLLRLWLMHIQHIPTSRKFDRRESKEGDKDGAKGS
ncbi:hypothetical protein GG496_001998 [Candidatus Fervidibacteria bacterium JGI MDM2 JNZ-1-D12]